ncbi:hypothetical protein [Leptolyngbya sp. FACHB-261]|uniref:hypothetical protein n=1 Tax=Leptolyngbya sp. FACHB-261 TaxID=2692806 RepID=UPI001683826F|nr:hypothetical protein [Leptolyngbya sp. FACHB-261]MBD2100937.1 hypothetical protein [Leptolyngbya sp. FACHB-261]
MESAMTSRARIRFLIAVGVSISSIAGVGAVAAFASAGSHVVRGNLTAATAEARSIACNQIDVKSELRLASFTLKTLGSTTAEGQTLGEGCSYTLTFDDLLLFSVPQSRQLFDNRLLIKAPLVEGTFASLYSPYTAPIDLELPGSLSGVEPKSN